MNNPQVEDYLANAYFLNLYLKDIQNGKIAAESNLILWDSSRYLPETEFYLKALNITNSKLKIASPKRLTGAETVVIFDNSHDSLLKQFSAIKLSEFHNVITYQLSNKSTPKK